MHERNKEIIRDWEKTANEFEGDKALYWAGRMAGVKCEGTIRGIQNVGKIKETKEFIFEVSDYRPKEEAIQKAKELCPEGWEPSLYFGSQSSFFTGEDKKRYAETYIYRFVDKVEGASNEEVDDLSQDQIDELTAAYHKIHKMLDDSKQGTVVPITAQAIFHKLNGIADKLNAGDGDGAIADLQSLVDKLEKEVNRGEEEDNS